MNSFLYATTQIVHYPLQAKDNYTSTVVKVHRPCTRKNGKNQQAERRLISKPNLTLHWQCTIDEGKKKYQNVHY